MDRIIILISHELSVIWLSIYDYAGDSRDTVLVSLLLSFPKEKKLLEMNQKRPMKLGNYGNEGKEYNIHVNK